MQEILFRRNTGFAENTILTDDAPLPHGEPVTIRERHIKHKIGAYAQGMAGVMTNLSYSYETAGIVAEWTFAKDAYHEDIVNHELPRMRNVEQQGGVCLFDAPLEGHRFKVSARCLAGSWEPYLFIEGVGDFRDARSVSLVQGIVHGILPRIVEFAGPTAPKETSLILSCNDFGRELNDSGKLTMLPKSRR